MARGARERGQATVELALCLPLAALVLSVAFEAGAVAIDKARLWHAAREAARIASVDPDEAAIQKAALSAGLRPLSVKVSPGAGDRRLGEPVTVKVMHDPTASIPLLDPLVSRFRLEASVSMRIEQP